MRKLLLAIICLSVLSYWIYKENTTFGTTYYDVTSARLPASFDSYKIVQLSDLHDAQFGDEHEAIVKEVQAIAPDAIFITGDFVDRNRYKLEQSLVLVEKLKHMAPIYYVTGNHEISTNDTERIKEALTALNVRVLFDEAEVITSSEGGSIVIGGIEDPLSSRLEDDEAVEQSVVQAFENTPNGVFKILLSHRPEQFDVYVANKIDITFSGHAHGGQFRIPGIGGLISPGQGWFPKLTSGVHEKEGSQLVVSRGLGNSLMPVRLLNKAEIVVVTLRKSET